MYMYLYTHWGYWTHMTRTYSLNATNLPRRESRFLWKNQKYFLSLALGLLFFQHCRRFNKAIFLVLVFRHHVRRMWRIIKVLNTSNEIKCSNTCEKACHVKIAYACNQLIGIKWHCALWCYINSWAFCQTKVTKYHFICFSSQVVNS